MFYTQKALNKLTPEEYATKWQEEHKKKQLNADKFNMQVV
ncbi:MAG: hypothetical protein ACI9CF_001311 [Candidatus Omnitrophota bacterium]|jgi:hypothetical protein